MQETPSISTSQYTNGIEKIAPVCRENVRVVGTTRGVSWPSAGALAVLVLLSVLYLLCFLYWHPTNFFALTQDDSIYLSSAQALAQGRGYILPSVPGAPAATKYPILYPLILSTVWKVKNSFPANLTAAIAVTAFFGIAFVVLSFFWLRGLGGVTRREAFLLAAFCAFHPLILYFSLNVLSDIPFAALALGALIVAEKATAGDSPRGSAVFCGVLTGLSILMRMFGIAIALGIIAAAVTRRAWRQALAYCAGLLPFGAVALWRLIDPPRFPVPVSAAAASTVGWKDTWTYYTSYLAAWRIGVPDAHIFWALIRNNIASLLSAPANYFLDPMLVSNTPLGRAFLIIVTVAILAGIVRQARRHGWKAIHYTLVFYAGIILLWNFPISSRFLLPFLPLFVVGLWFEAKNGVRLILLTVRGGKSGTDMAVAAALAVLLAAFSGGVVWNYLGGMRKTILEQSSYRAGLLEEKRGAYEWLVQNTDPGATVIAYEDAAVYLYTGRQAMRPLVFTSADFYDPEKLRGTSAHMADVAYGLNAGYWLFSDDDFGIDWPSAYAVAHARLSAIERGLPLVYRSKGGRVRVYRLNRP